MAKPPPGAIDCPPPGPMLLAARPTAEDHNSGWEQETQLALGGYLIARYIEWARQDNR